MSVNFKKMSVDITSGATSSNGLDLGTGYAHMYLEIPSYASGGTHYIKTSSDGSTFRRLYVPSDDASGVHVEEFQINQSISNCVAPLPAMGLRYVQIETTTGVTDATTTYNLIFG